ncbi:MAG: phytanoyl-CoA dioxygenase family protein [Deltaproteobacteria bacterium]|nr:phytanoyl-CoA dioxygenase family protein [Deltaproteobacteria bacterium]MBW2416486.1 phytanoyl-CoA dioxygenase family protein [Deltaproteobacteria bacterium]
MPGDAPCLDEPYALTAGQVARYAEDGFVQLERVFRPGELDFFEPHVTREARARAWNRDIPFEERSTYDRAFLQATNLWTFDGTVRALSFSRRLARAASELMGTRGVRMYHDQALYKEPGFGLTPWHVDQQYWPLDSDRAVTAWIPFQPVPLEMGPVSFARGSHRLDIARDLPIGDESDAVISRAVADRGLDDVVVPFALGDVSFHAGWTLHHADANRTESPRRVHTVIYIDVDMRLAEPRNAAQKFDRRVWSPSTQPGEIMDDPLNPVLFSA